LIALLGGAAVVGLIWRDRAFCRGFYPVGLLLGTYGRGGMLAVRNGDPSACASCTGKDCIVACNRDRWDSRTCPSLLNAGNPSGSCLRFCPGRMGLAPVGVLKKGTGHALTW